LQELDKDIRRLVIWTDTRKKFQAELTAVYSSKADRGVPLKPFEVYTKTRFVSNTEKEYVAKKYKKRLEYRFELLDLSLDAVSSVRARLEGSCLLSGED